MMNSTKFNLSIVMATFNGEKYLKQQIDSILNQTYRHFELIICDDGSTDDTVEIIESYIKEYTCITLHKNDTQLGIVKNFEKGIELAQSKHIALSDQDDIWKYDKLEIMINEMKRHEESDGNIPVLVHSDLFIIDEENKNIYPSYHMFKGYQLKETKDLNHIISRCGVMGNTILMNKKLKELALPFPVNLDIHDYWIALISELYGKRSTIKQPLVGYRIHDGNASNSKSKVYRKTSFNVKLPYMHLKREEILKPLLERSDLSDDDKIVIKLFLKYLNLDGNRLSIYYTLVKNDFIGKTFLKRWKLFFLLLLYRA